MSLFQPLVWKIAMKICLILIKCPDANATETKMGISTKSSLVILNLFTLSRLA
jgi:hypothetical protein